MKDYEKFFMPSSDLQKGKEFYQEILGLDVKFGFPSMGMIAFKVGNTEPELF